jgi:hypothetical protein
MYRFTTHSNGTLTISPVLQEDAGEYACTAVPRVDEKTSQHQTYAARLILAGWIIILVCLHTTIL